MGVATPDVVVTVAVVDVIVLVAVVVPGWTPSEVHRDENLDRPQGEEMGRVGVGQKPFILAWQCTRLGPCRKFPGLNAGDIRSLLGTPPYPLSNSSVRGAGVRKCPSLDLMLV